MKSSTSGKHGPSRTFTDLHGPARTNTASGDSLCAVLESPWRSVLVREAPLRLGNTAKQALRAAFPARSAAARGGNTAKPPLRPFQSLLRETPTPQSGAPSKDSPEPPPPDAATSVNFAAFRRHHTAQESQNTAMARPITASSRHNFLPRPHFAAFLSQNTAPSPRQAPPKKGNAASRALFAVFMDYPRDKACYNPTKKLALPQRYRQKPRLRRFGIPSGAESRHFQEIR
jgi:hypothetical protein